MKFTKEDFSIAFDFPNDFTCEAIAIVANAKLKKMLETSPKVYGYIGEYGSSWGSYPPGTFIQENLSHSAKLVDIKEIE